MSQQTIRATVRQPRVTATVDETTTVVHTEATPITVDAPQPDRITRVVYAGSPGPAGPAGAPGPAGPPGPASGGSYIHTQNAPAAVWSVTHNLGFNPNVTVEDSAGSIVEGEISYESTNTLTLMFTAAFGGTAYLS